MKNGFENRSNLTQFMSFSAFLLPAFLSGHTKKTTLEKKDRAGRRHFAEQIKKKQKFLPKKKEPEKSKIVFLMMKPRPMINWRDCFVDRRDELAPRTFDMSRVLDHCLPLKCG